MSKRTKTTETAPVDQVATSPASAEPTEPTATPLELARARLAREEGALAEARAQLDAAKAQRQHAEERFDDVRLEDRTEALRLQLTNAREDVASGERTIKRCEGRVDVARALVDRLQRAEDLVELERLQQVIADEAGAARTALQAIVDVDKLLDAAVLTVVAHHGRGREAYEAAKKIAHAVGRAADFSTNTTKPDLRVVREDARVLVSAARLQDGRDGLEAWLQTIVASGTNVPEYLLDEANEFTARQERANAIERDRQRMAAAFAQGQLAGPPPKTPETTTTTTETTAPTEGA